jgi:bile acid:Na+ symporter, BASS family
MRLIEGFFFTLLWATSFSLTAAFLVSRMLWVGLGVTPAELRDTLRARGVVVRTLLANVLAVPALAVVLVTVLPLTADVRVAILLLAVVPGGVDVLSRRPATARGQVSPAALVFLLSSVAIVVTPALRVLMQQVGPPMVLSYGRLVAVSVLGLLVPLLGGLVIRATAPVAADVLTRVTAALSLVLFIAATLAIVVVGGGQRHGLGPLDLLALALFVLGAGAIGWLLGGPATPTRRLLADVTAMRNVGLALMIATVAVPHGGVALAVVLFVVVLTALRVAFAWPELARRRRLAVDHAVPSA